jgi:Predicted hydrolases or acyltransferases (alpha/beta hydrolase superfamily)
MSTITTKDGTQIYYKDWGAGQPVLFSHGWPLSADSWESQMVFIASNGYRCIAHDRRGHGRSSQPWSGNEMDTYADDLSELIETLDLKGAVLIGFSAGGGEVARYIGRHGTKRVAKAALISAVPPLMLKTAANPDGLPIKVFDGIRLGSIADRSQFYMDLASGPFFGANRPGAKVSQGMIDSFWLQGMQAGAQEHLRLHQGVLRDGFHRRPQEVRCADADHSRRRRPDRADRRRGSSFSEAGQERDPKDLPGRSPRPRVHAQRPAQRRPAGIP